MAAKERADLLRSARRKILQNSICRQGRTNQNRILQKFLSSLTPSGVGRKSRQSSTKSASMGTGRVEPEAMCALASRLAASPPAQRRLVDAPLPVGSPAIALAALPARPPREGAPGGRPLRKRPGVRRQVGTGSSCAAGPVCRVPNGGFEINVLFDVGPGSPRRAARTARRRSFCGRHRRVRADWGREGPASSLVAGRRNDRRDRRARNLAAGRGQAPSPPDRRSITRWRGCVRRRPCGRRLGGARPDPHHASFRANRECCGA